MQLFSNVIEKLHHYSWRRVFESTGSLKGFLIRFSFAISGHPSVEIGLAAVSLARSVHHLVKKSGLLFAALYMKQCGVALQRYYACCRPRQQVVFDSSPVSVSLTRSGLPRIIPIHHRHRISVRDDRADYLVRLYLWFF